MAILIGNELKKALREKIIGVEPLDESQIGPGSVDLTLGNDFRIFKKQQEIYHIKDESRFEDVTESVHINDGDYIKINPGEMILGITKEKILLSKSISGRLEGRSRSVTHNFKISITNFCKKIDPST